MLVLSRDDFVQHLHDNPATAFVPGQETETRPFDRCKELLVTSSTQLVFPVAEKCEVIVDQPLQ